MGSLSGIRSDLARVVAVARRDFAIERSYSLRFLIGLGSTLVGILISYQTDKLITDAPELAEWGGSYFDFIMVGFAIIAVAQLGLGAFKRAVSTEMSTGTLEVLLATPTPMWTLLTGSIALPSVITAIELGFFLGIGLGWLGGGLSLSGLAPALVVIALTFLSFCSLGIIGAGFMVLTKRGDPITMVVGLATTVLAGALVPVATFPELLRWIAPVFPAYHGIRGSRLALLTDAPLADIAPYAGALVLYDVVLLSVALWTFRRAVEVARAAGTLGSY